VWQAGCPVQQWLLPLQSAFRTADKALAIKESLPQRALVFVICAVLNNQ